MEDRHLAAFGGFFDGGFCRYRGFTAFFLVIFHIMGNPVFMGKGICS